jgi:very-short-patch-repair endonuclease
MRCKYCDREISNRGSLKTHEKSCKIIQSLDIDKLREMYYEKFNTIEEISKIYKISHQKMSNLLFIKGRKRNRKKNSITSYICQYCTKRINGKGNLKQHEKICKNCNTDNKSYDVIKEEIINLYVNEHKSTRFIRKKYKLQYSTLKEILGDKIRTLSESAILSHKLYPDSFKHSEESKIRLSKIRLEYMKNNPDKTAWRKSNMSYPEKIFYNKLKELKLDKKHLIVREKSEFPYFIDFAFINEKLAVEIDGSQHNLPERKKKDDKKDKLLKEKGWRVFRVTAKEVNIDTYNVIDNLLKFLDSSNNYIKFGILTNEEYNIDMYYCECGNEKTKYSKNCIKCSGKLSSLSQRKVERPPYTQLINEVNELGYAGTGRKYGVSDNSIRKWIKYYEKKEI